MLARTFKIDPADQLIDLILTRRQWIRRRVDRIELLGRSVVRVRTELTLNFEPVMRSLYGVAERGNRGCSKEPVGRVFLPLLVGKRGVANSYSISDESGGLVPRLNRIEERRALARSLLRRNPESAKEPASEEELFSFLDGESSTESGLRHKSEKYSVPEDLLRSMRECYYVLAEVEMAVSRRVLVVEYFVQMLEQRKSVTWRFVDNVAKIDDLTGLRKWRWNPKLTHGMFVDVPIEDWRSSSSYHLEIECPDGGIVFPAQPDGDVSMAALGGPSAFPRIRASLPDDRGAGSSEVLQLHRDGWLLSIARFTCHIKVVPPSDSGKVERSIVGVLLLPIHQGPMRVLVIVSVASAFASVVSQWLGFRIAVPLLAVPLITIVAGYLSVADKSDLTGHMLRTSRGLVLANGLAAVSNILITAYVNGWLRLLAVAPAVLGIVAMSAVVRRFFLSRRLAERWAQRAGQMSMRSMAASSSILGSTFGRPSESS